MPKLKTYLLLTAINRYPYIRPLHGCINDANNLQNYLIQAAQAQNKELVSKELYDQEATKANIVEAFAEHLGQATEEDICVFYFSGHGGQEEAHPAFEKHESDGKLEVLACYDSRLKRQGSFLADKELRYLIHQLYQKTKAQITTIFDCCHSGGNAKNALLTPRRLMDDAEGRKWEDFIFGGEITAEAVQKATALEDVLPQGKFLHLAACEDKESAYEVNGEGIFTSNLIALLKQTKGEISYRNLINILALKLQGSYKQRPQLYSFGAKELPFRAFLGGITQHQKQQANLIYNQHEKAWFLDMGALHGISQNNPHLSIELLDEEDKVLTKAENFSVLPNYSILQFGTDASLDTQRTYKVRISGLMISVLRVHCSGEEAGVQLFKQQWQEMGKNANFIHLSKDLSTADYIVHAENQRYSILLPANNLPVTDHIEAYEKNSVRQLMDYLNQIARWLFVRRLENPSTNIQPNPPLKMQVYVKNAAKEIQEVKIKGKQLILKHTVVPPEKDLKNPPFVELRVQISNPTDKPYYCALLYLSQDFGIYPDFLEEKVKEILPHKSVYSYGGQFLYDKQSPFIIDYNWEAETHYLMLLVSTHSFNIDVFQQTSLPTPPTSVPEETIGTRRLYRPKAIQFPDWTTQLIELKMPNPYFKADIGV